MWGDDGNGPPPKGEVDLLPQSHIIIIIGHGRDESKEMEEQ